MSSPLLNRTKRHLFADYQPGHFAWALEPKPVARLECSPTATTMR